jgi:lipopolysaccharide export system permease protein
MKLIDRFLMRQLLPLFLLGIMAFTALILGVGGIYKMIRIAEDHNVNIMVVATAFVYKLPEIVTYTLPMATLFCILLVFNRMCSDLESIACRAGGISFVRLLAPAVAFAFCVSLFALFMNDRAVPASNARFNRLIENLKSQGGFEITNMFLKEEDEQGQLKRAILINEVTDRRLLGVTIQEYENNRPVQVVFAEQAHASRDNKLILHEAEIYKAHRTAEGRPKDYTHVETRDTMELELMRSFDDMLKQQKQSDEMTIRELRLEIESLKQQGVERAIIGKKSVDFHGKLAIPFASLAFALIAAPLAMTPQRASSSVGLGVSVIIIFFYYMFQQLFRGLGGTLINSALASWMPNIIVFTIGLFLCAKAERR